jgi:signal transduction histidine kinase
MDDHNLHAIVLDALRDPVMVVDGSGEVLLANPAAMRVLDLARADGGSAGRPVLDGAAIMELVRRAERVRVDAVPVPGDASQVIDVEAMPGGAPDSPRCWMLRIRAADTLEREFWSDSAVATVAHEIRNPITAMLNALGALSASGPAETTPAGGSLARGAFERSTRRLARLVDGLLDLSRVRTGALRLQRSPLSVDDFVQRIVTDFRVLHPATAERLAVEPIAAWMTVYVDEDRAEQSLWNLLSNAVRFTPRTQKVIVRVEAAGVESMEDSLRLVPWDVIGHPRLVRIDVEDTGLGMTPETLEHLFDRHHSAGAGGDGAHLGLSITRALVDAHDGWVSVDSRLGEGTTVSMFVPEDAASATLLSGVRLAERESARRRAVHRPTAIAVLQRTKGPSWSHLIARLPRPVKLQPQEPVSPRECAVWTLSADLAVALIPLDASGEPSDMLGIPERVVEEGAWEMKGFIAGWCGERETSFAQAFHRAATKMIRARCDSALGDEAAGAAVNTSGADEPASER